MSVKLDSAKSVPFGEDASQTLARPPGVYLKAGDARKQKMVTLSLGGPW